MPSVRFRQQWILLTVALLLVGITISWNLYAEYKMTDGQERGLLVVQAKVVEYVINVSKVLLNEQGAFAGVILASLGPEYFDTLLQSVLCAADMRATLIHGCGKVIFEAPYRKGSGRRGVRSRTGSSLSPALEKRAGNQPFRGHYPLFRHGSSDGLAHNPASVGTHGYALAGRDQPGSCGPFQHLAYCGVRPGMLVCHDCPATTLGLFFHYERNDLSLH